MSGALEALVRILGDALAPLAARLDGDPTDVLQDLGLRLPDAALAGGAVPQGLQAATAACAALPDAVAALTAALGGNDDAAILAASTRLGQRVVQTGAAFAQLGAAIDAAVQGTAGLTPGQKARLGAAARALPERLIGLALIAWIEVRAKGAKQALELAGLIDDTPIPSDPADPSLPPHRERRLRFDRIGALFSDPGRHLADLYGFGTPGFDGLELLGRLKRMLDRPDGETLLIDAPGQPAALEAFVFRLAVEPGSLPGLRLRLRVPAQKDLDVVAPLGDPWTATAAAKARFAGGLEILVDPAAGLSLAPPAADATVDLAFGLGAKRSDGKPMVLIGRPGASRLEIGEIGARLPFRASAASGAASPASKLGAALDIKGGRLAIDTSGSDGFVATLLSGVKVEAPFDLGAAYDTDGGLRFTGSATIEVALPAHVALGPVRIPTLYLIGGFADGTVPVEFSADIAADLGPLSATVNRLGATARLSFPAGGGNAGPVQIDLAFKGPTGVGLVVDAGVVKGGGFLSVDSARGEYAGALELRFAEFLTLSAIGVITTRMPDGSPGFSLVVIISAEFGTGIQLGFGFTLLGVGGLLGLNRTMRLDALADGVRAGTLDNILFPRDVVANAPQIISDLRTCFPPQTGTFLIGPMAKLGWGTPTLVSLSLGIIIEIPGNVAIVGVLRVALPTDDAAIVVLQVSFIGALEFDKARGWFFASLYESRVLFITIQGEMGLLIAVGDDADFLISVGGFHPRFAPPPLPFPEPRRIALDILNTAVARLRAEGYFAVTTNSVQFGAHAEAFFGFSALNVSGSITLDALIRFSPFYFIVDFSSQFSVKVFGVGVWGLRIRLEVEGPTPWRAHGSAGISLLFFDIDVDIDVTWGEKRDTTLPPVAVMPQLLAEFGKADNWRPRLPPGGNLLVALAKLPDAEATLVFHPLGSIAVTQRFAPLDLKLDKVGQQKPADGNRFSLAAAGAAFGKRGDVRERFAPAQFIDLSDDDRLARKAFEDMNAGVEIAWSGTQLDSGASITRVARYELVTIDTEARRHRRIFSVLSALLFGHFLKGAAVALSSLSARTFDLKVPVKDGVRPRQEGFAVALTETNGALGTAVFASEAEANDALAQAVAADRKLAGKLHVLPQFELAA